MVEGSGLLSQRIPFKSQGEVVQRRQSFGWDGTNFTEFEAKQVPTAYNEFVLLDFTGRVTTVHSQSPLSSATA